MNREVWTRRGAAAGALVCGALAIGATTGIAQDLWAVRQAESRSAVLPAPTPAIAARPWVRPSPVLRLNGGGAKARIGEFLNSQLGDLGLVVTSVDPSTTRPLGDGLSLVEVRVQAKGDASATRAAAEWVAINREAVRMKSLSLSSGPDGEPICTLVLLMVTA